MPILLNAQSVPDIPAWLLFPFVLMLLAIALGPMIAGNWWEFNRNKLIVALTLGIPTGIILITMGRAPELIHQIIFDYIPFIVLLWGLFAVTGGIHLRGDLKATPATNTAIMAIGGVLASFMGTTGAAMLFIRPLIATNKQRKHKVHTILFFIAVVANCGGLLTPLGDPPLFLLYLRGASFGWFFKMLPEWAIVNASLLIVFFIMDTISYRREDPADIALDNAERTPIKITGNINFLWLLGIILSVAFINPQHVPIMQTNKWAGFLREGAILLMIIASVLTTPKRVREANRFTWHPIIEVAFLFIGIFITMTPALLYLNQHATQLGLETPIQFYFATGALSGFLDNAPTALAFHAVAEGLPEALPMVAGINEMLFVAICMGSVFFGAMTYIGNGPNFMVKAIAEENGIKMPSFFRYMYRFSLIILLPIYILAGVLFLM